MIADTINTLEEARELAIGSDTYCIEYDNFCSISLTDPKGVFEGSEITWDTFVFEDRSVACRRKVIDKYTKVVESETTWHKSESLQELLDKGFVGDCKACKTHNHFVKEWSSE